MADRITNDADLIDSRDVIRRLAELRAEDIAELAEDDQAELAALEALEEEAEGYCDWLHGATLVRDSYFVEHAQAMAEDIGAVDPGAAWPLGCIDWHTAAEELRQDYTAVDFNGVEYWVR